jgi:predicted aldo/keto reductase-like oxidoreductase
MVLSGMNEEVHVEENLRIASEARPNAFSQEELALVKKAARAYRSLMKAGCTGCRYCMPCPSGVNIPACFESYNSYHMFGDKRAKLSYTVSNGGVMSGEPPSFASECTQCRECLEKCPQKLPIPELLKDVKNDMEGIMTRPMVWLAKKLLKVKHG